MGRQESTRGKLARLRRERGAPPRQSRGRRAREFPDGLRAIWSGAPAAVLRARRATPRQPRITAGRGPAVIRRTCPWRRICWVPTPCAGRTWLWPGTRTVHSPWRRWITRIPLRSLASPGIPRWAPSTCVAQCSSTRRRPASRAARACTSTWWAWAGSRESATCRGRGSSGVRASRAAPCRRGDRRRSGSPGVLLREVLRPPSTGGQDADRRGHATVRGPAAPRPLPPHASFDAWRAEGREAADHGARTARVQRVRETCLAAPRRRRGSTTSPAGRTSSRESSSTTAKTSSP